MRLGNGSQGIVTGFAKPEARPVVASGQLTPIHPTSQWPIVRFTNGVEMTVSPVAFEIRERGVLHARFDQVPLMLGFAITIHKSQGMTLQRVDLHLAEAFGAGMVYVALSRCRSLDQVTISTFDPRRISACPTALQFYDKMRKAHALADKQKEQNWEKDVLKSTTSASSSDLDDTILPSFSSNPPKLA